MPFGLAISLCLHGALIGWAVLSMRAVDQFPSENTPVISAELVTPSEFLRLKQGSENAKVLESKAKEEPTPDESRNDTNRPNNAPPPEPSAPPPVAETEPPPGPTPDEKKLLEEKIEEARKADEAEALQKAAAAAAEKKAAAEAKAIAAAEAKKKAEAEAKKKAEAEKKRKKAEADKKKKLAAEKKRKEEAKKKLDVNKLAQLLDQLPDDGQRKALIDKDPRLKGQEASGTSRTATAVGREAGTATGTDSVLSAREIDLLKGMIRSQLEPCWRVPAAGGGVEPAVVTLRWKLRANGALDGDPVVTEAPSGPIGQIASEAALRAVKSCQPFRLPAQNYESWKDIIWRFDPRELL